MYVPDDVLEEASATRYQMLPQKSKLCYQNELEKFTQWQTEKRTKSGFFRKLLRTALTQKQVAAIKEVTNKIDDDLRMVEFNNWKIDKLHTYTHCKNCKKVMNC
jgi:hypothetical protein